MNAMKVYCNPLEISYKYQHPLHGKYAYKEAADPTLILFNGLYYLFTSKCGGFYYSEDLFEWKFHEDRNLEIHGYAPDVNEYDGYLYFCASSYAKKCKILRSKDPFKGFELVSAPFAFWDPHLYFENDRAYLYWGCSCKQPIHAIEMDIKTMQPIGKKKDIVFGNAKAHGIDNKEIYGKEKKSLWQRYIELFTGSGTFIEGAFLNKIGDKYYFQYATPGTEYPTYGDAVLTGDSPLGDYTWQKHNPYSIVPGGFTQGAGHGSTFYDKHGNLWHTASVCVGVNHNFERRLGLWCAGVDKDGILFCNQYFADYPKRIPDGKFDPMSIVPEWMLLSYHKKVKASSYRDNCLPKNVVDESIKSVWSSESNKAGEWLVMDLENEYDVKAVQVNFGDYLTAKKKAPRKEYGGTISQERYIESELVKYRYRLEYSTDGVEWKPFAEGDYDTTLPHKLCESDIRAKFIRITFVSAPYGQNFTLSGLRVFGLADGQKPKESEILSAIRTNDTTAKIKWQQQGDVTGYCIRIGIAPEKLYNSVLLYGQTDYTVTFLNREAEEYYFAVDTFNESGITQGKVNKLLQNKVGAVCLQLTK